MRKREYAVSNAPVGDALEYGYDRVVVERSVDRETIERIATEIIPTLRAGS